MSLFEKLFGENANDKKNDNDEKNDNDKKNDNDEKNDNDIEDLLNQLLKNKSSNAVSPNYHSVFYGIKGLYFINKKDFAIVGKNEDGVRLFVKLALDMTKGLRQIDIPEQFYSMPIHIFPEKGVVLEIPNPTYECECNYVALLFGEAKKMYTSEYYASRNVFKLCCITESMRMSYDTEIDSFDKFVKATIGVEI